MTLLPIVERELRVAARRRTTYRARSGVAFVATLVGIVTFLSSQVAPTLKFGQLLFWGIAGMSMSYCLVAGRQMTADCLSEEKREGTFGLLFLTDLKGYDVVLGKLAARSFNGFYGLMATVPILAIPLLVGGVTWGEFWRMVIVLVAAFLFSLSIGIFVSSVSRHYHEAMGRNFALALLLMALPSACAAGFFAWHPNRPLMAPLLFSCPAYTFTLCSDFFYKTNTVNYWLSTATILVLTIVLTSLACRFAPRSWQDKPALPRPKEAPPGEKWRWWKEGGGEKRAVQRKKLLDQNAYYWLASRPYVKPAWVWTLLGLTALWLGRTAAAVGRLEATVCVGGALLLNSTLKLWIALESAQQLAADRKSGAFELLLSTPLTVDEILRGQIAALRRQFFKPLLVVIAMELLFVAGVVSPAFRLVMDASAAELAWIWTAGIAMLVADIVALSVTGMAAGISAKNYTQASMRAVRQVLILPWALYGILAAALDISIEWKPEWNTYLTWNYQLPLWFCIGIGCDVFFTRSAWRRLRGQFRELAMRDPSVAQPGFFALLRKGAGALARNLAGEKAAGPAGKPRPSAIVPATVIALLACVLAFVLVRRSFHTKIPLIQLGKPSTSLRIASARDGILFVLPDGTIWRWGRVDGIPELRAATLKQIGTNDDWLDVFSGQGVMSALRRDGALLEWDPDQRAFKEPPQFKSSGDWKQISRGFNFSVGLKNDGTAWAWGNNDRGQLGNWKNTPGILVTNPFPGLRTKYHGEIGSNLTSLFKTPVKVNSDMKWKAVQSLGASAIAISQDGRLWGWGYLRPTFAGNEEIYGFPVQICAETNWVSIEDDGPAAVVRNSSNELWNVSWLINQPSSNAPAASRIYKIGFFPASTHPAFIAEGNSPFCYEIRRDGTLWSYPLAWWPGGTVPPQPSRQIGSRRDWISIWSNVQTIVGMTADGTIWTLGADLGHEPRAHYKSRLQIWSQHLAGGPASPLTYTSTGYDLNEEPKPLARVTPPGLNSTKNTQ